MPRIDHPTPMGPPKEHDYIIQVHKVKKMKAHKFIWKISNHAEGVRKKGDNSLSFTLRGS